MKHTLYIRISLSGICLTIVFLFTGCSVFGAIGNAISQGYENSVAYFNGYYNAKWLFDEAEDEVLENISKNRNLDSVSTSNIQISAVVKEKFNKVIDKCSNILAFHSSSTLVDDALLLIGKSFFYQNEYQKAERKFSELLTQYPNSSLVLETQIWYAQTEEKLKKTDAGIRICESTIETAKANDERKIEIQAHRILGRLFLQQKEIDKAVSEFEKEIELANDDDIKAEGQIYIGNIYFSEEQYDKAAEIYKKVGEYTSDIYMNYYSARQASISYRKINESEKGLPLVNAIINNFRYQAYLPEMLYERANIYSAIGRKDDAINEYIKVDTSFTTSEFSKRSAYRLGNIFEKEVVDYRSASKYYNEAASSPITSISKESRGKYNALNKYFTDWQNIKDSDSLLFVLTDTSKRSGRDSVSTEVPVSDTNISKTPALDTSVVEMTSVYGRKASTMQERSKSLISDSLKAAADSTKRKLEIMAARYMKPQFDSLKIYRSHLDTAQYFVARALIQESKISADSLSKLRFIADSLKKETQLCSTRIADSLDMRKSYAAQDLGDVFYTDLGISDSALYWYEKSINWSYNHYSSPRILYILAELVQKDTAAGKSNSEEYYRRLDRDFHETIYAREARRLLGKENYDTKRDTAAVFFEQASELMEKRQYDDAITALRNIAQDYRTSPYAAKSEYTIGWIFENNLEKPESAKIQYDKVVKNYKGTLYATEASKRSRVLESYGNPKQDTTKIVNPSLTKPPVTKTNADSVKASPVNMDSVKTAKAAMDTVKRSGISRLGPAINDTSDVKISKKDSIGTPTSPAEKRNRIPDSIGKDSVVSGKNLLN